MGLGTAGIGQKNPTSNKLLDLYGEGGPAISLYREILLDEAVQNKVMVKNLTPEEVQTVFANENMVD